MGYHEKIMNAPCVVPKGMPDSMDEYILGVNAYRLGHRDARHAAAEIGLAADAEIEELRAILADVLGAWGDGFRMGDPRETQIFQKAFRIAKGNR